MKCPPVVPDPAAWSNQKSKNKMVILRKLVRRAYLSGLGDTLSIETYWIRSCGCLSETHFVRDSQTWKWDTAPAAKSNAAISTFTNCVM